jgi:hypothetical protein
VQDRAPQGRGAGDLRELETQAETRIDFRFEISDWKFEIVTGSGRRLSQAVNRS